MAHVTESIANEIPSQYYKLYLQYKQFPSLICHSVGSAYALFLIEMFFFREMDS